MLDAQRLSEYYAARQFSDKTFRSACYAPHVSLYFGMVGDVLACCQNRKYPLGNVTQQSIDEIWQGEKARTLRERLERDDFAAGCQVCQWQISVGNYDTAYTRTFDHYPVAEHNPEWPRMMEFELSNTCNLECTMCYGFFSSLIRTNREHLPPLPKVYGDEFFRQLRPYVNHLRFARFYGGEPFLAQEPYRVWDIVVEDGLDFPCHVTTNGTQFNARVERVLNAMPVSVAVSLDAMTAPTYESIRINASFEAVMQNIRRFRQYCRQRNTHFGFAFCLMQQNWHEFGDLLLFAEELECEVTVNLVYGPPHCNLYALPADELAKVADSLERQSTAILPHLKINRRVWMEQVEDLRRRVDRSADASATPFDVPRTLIYRSTDLNATGRYGGWTAEESRRELEVWLRGAEIESFECGNDDRVSAVGQETVLGLPADECREQKFTDLLAKLRSLHGEENHLTINRGPSHVDQIFEFHGPEDRMFVARVMSVPVLDEFDLPQGATALAATGWVTAAECPLTAEDLRRELVASEATDRSVWLHCDHALRITEAGGNFAAWNVDPAGLIGQPIETLAAHFGAPQAMSCLERRLYVERYQVEYVTRGNAWQILASKVRRFAPDGRSLGWHYLATIRDNQRDVKSAAEVLAQWRPNDTIDRLAWSTGPGAAETHSLTFLGMPAQPFHGRSLEEIVALLEARYGPAVKQSLEDNSSYADWTVEFQAPDGTLFVARLIRLVQRRDRLGAVDHTVLGVGVRPTASDANWSVEALTKELDAWAGASRALWARCDADLTVGEFQGCRDDWPAADDGLIGQPINALIERHGTVTTTRCLKRSPLADQHELCLTSGAKRWQVLGARWRTLDERGRPNGWLIGLTWRDEPATD